MTTSIVNFSSEIPANMLCSYLNDKHISAQVIEQEGKFIVAVEGDDDVQAAIRIAREFVKQPTDPRYQASAWHQGVTTKTTKWRFNSDAFVDKALSSPFTSIIFILCTLIFIFSSLGYFQSIVTDLSIQPIDLLLQNHQWWRLIGPDFLHFSITHVTFNLLWWCMLGSMLERTFGTSSLILFFVLSSLSSNLGQLYFNGPNFGGMSGVVYALVGFVWWIGWLKPQWGLRLSNPLVYFLLAWLVIGYFDILWVNMANEAHLFGLIAGCLMALVASSFYNKKGKHN